MPRLPGATEYRGTHRAHKVYAHVHRMSGLFAILVTRTRILKVPGTVTVLSHMNAMSLRPHADEIRFFAETSAANGGPRIAERASKLIGRLPN